MSGQLKSILRQVCCHRTVYCGLCGCHGFAAWSTGKPEVYLPMAALYLALAVLPGD